MRYLLLVFSMAACAAPAQETDTCGAAGYQALIGQPESAFATMTFPDTTRFIGPDTAMTMDFDPERLNFYIDDGGRITAVRCG